MTYAHFSLLYDGDAVRDGEIDVMDLAPALLGLADAIKATGKIALGPHADVSLKIRTMEKGSFEVLMNAVTTGDVGLAWHVLKDFYRSEDTQTAKAVVETLFMTGTALGGVVTFLKWRKGRAIDRLERLTDGRTRVTIDGTELFLGPGVAEAAADPSVRAGLERAIADPLERDGIDTIRFGNRDTSVLVTKDERVFFRSATEPDAEFSSIYEKVFSIVTLSFKAGNKWKLHDGQGTRNVTLSDQQFLDRIEKGQVRFAKGDLLVCLVRETAARSGSGFRSQYEIIQVKEHRPYRAPDALPF